MHPWISIDVADKARENAFEGNLSHFSASNGATFGFTRSDDTITHFGRPSGDYLLLSLTISGAVHLTSKDGSSRTVRAGQNLVVLDGSLPTSTRTLDHSLVYLTLPMDQVLSQLGFEYRPSQTGFAQIPSQGLAPFLESQLHLMARECTRLSEVETLHLADVLQSLALGTLSRSRARHASSEVQVQAQALYLAAARYIALNLGVAELGADSVAAAIHCSRSTLYRVFQEREDTVGRHIRRERFKLAKSYLLNEPEFSIQIVAHLCGYGTPESFGRFFRDQAGMSPTTFRNEGF